METNYSRIELLALLKVYNKTTDLKIQNVDKLKKDEIYNMCVVYSLLPKNEYIPNKINLTNIPRAHLMENIEMHHLKQGTNVPFEVTKMRKKELIEYIELNNIKHYTPEDLKQEIEELQINRYRENVILYNIIKYDDIDYKNISNKHDFIVKNNLDTDIGHFQEYTEFIEEVYKSYEKFCKNTGKNPPNHEIKTLPKFVQILKDLINKV